MLTPNRKTDYYKINGPTTPFVLHLNLLIPDLKVQQPDVEIKATIKDSQGKVIGTLYQPNVSKWTSFYEPFGKDNYLMGPKYKETVPGGKYSIEISSVSTLYRAGSGRYSLAVGDEEVFPPNEIANAAILIPKLDREFFAITENTTVTLQSQTNSMWYVFIIILVILILILVVGRVLYTTLKTQSVAVLSTPVILSTHRSASSAYQ